MHVRPDVSQQRATGFDHAYETAAAHATADVPTVGGGTLAGERRNRSARPTERTTFARSSKHS